MHGDSRPAAGDRPLRVVVAGAGAMGTTWSHAVHRHPELELAGIVDVDARRARAAALRLRRPDLPVGASLTDIDGVVDAVVNATPPAAHRDVTGAALTAGVAVLSEKPFAADLAQAVSLHELARAQRRLLMVAQTRTYDPGLVRLRELAARLGRLDLVTTDFRRAYRPAGFRVEMENPLLLDMAVHSFDAVRYLTGQQPVAVYAVEFNPAHSWFAGSASAVVTVELTAGVRYVYTGSWCATGVQTSWNGRWRVDGSSGSATWGGDSAPTLTLADPPPGAADDDTRAADDGTGAPDADLGSAVAGPLADFVSALRTGVRPWGDSQDNLHTLAIAEAAVRSARRGERVLVADLLAEAGQAR